MLRTVWIYIVPNINAIAQQVNGDNEDVDISNSEDIVTLLAKLKEYKIDVDALLPIVMQWHYRRYSSEVC